MLRVEHFGFGRHHERGATGHLLVNDPNDLGMSVPVDEGGHVVGKVNAGDAVEIGDAATLAVRGVGWVRGAKNSVARDSPGEDFLRSSEELGATRDFGAAG
jgi:hypothetical protein